MFTYDIIINPASRNGRTGSRVEHIAKLASEADLDCQFIVTRYPKHASEIARQSTADVCVAVGGDGTVHEVARGLVGKPKARLAVWPVGTGNDFVKMTAVPKKIAVAIQKTKQFVFQKVDVGRISWEDHEGSGSDIFLNAVGIGFDAAAAGRAPRYKHLPGSAAAYLAAVFATLSSWSGPLVSVKSENLSFDGPLLLVTAGNGKSSGGRFYLTPDADIRDGLLDVCLIRNASVPRILAMLPRAFWGGHTTCPEVTMSREHELHITSESGLSIHADGEILSMNARDIQIQIDPGALEVAFPSDADPMLQTI